MGGGILSLGEGSSKVRHSSAWPLGRALSRNSAAWPCRQKFVTWESWCLVKSSAVGLQRSWGADILLASHLSGVVSPQGHSANLLRSVFKLFKLGRLVEMIRIAHHNVITWTCKSLKLSLSTAMIEVSLILTLVYVNQLSSLKH